MSWDEQNTKILRKLWAQGLSAAKISAQIPGKSRNAIIGRAHRLKLEARAVSRRPALKINIDNNVKSGIKTQKLGRKGKFRALLLDKNFPEENPTPLVELTDNHCRFPLGEKLEPAKFFCGRKPVQKEAGNFPYCELHLLYSYVSRNEKEEDEITDEDIPKYINLKKKIKSA